MSKSRKVLGKILQAAQHPTPERTVVQKKKKKKNQLYPPQEEEFPKKNQSESKVTELLQPAATLSCAILEQHFFFGTPVTMVHDLIMLMMLPPFVECLCFLSVLEFFQIGT
ncbi:hypothetical protein AMECASPLE_019093 [Ameca splendens]|uniref:Uncharacterized protein n=1 Tax=Ameca splendens TaxID=208324 RepID=A0ABV0Z1V3_9TELE